MIYQARISLFFFMVGASGTDPAMKKLDQDSNLAVQHFVVDAVVVGDVVVVVEKNLNISSGSTLLLEQNRYSEK